MVFTIVQVINLKSSLSEVLFALNGAYVPHFLVSLHKPRILVKEYYDLLFLAGEVRHMGKV